MNLVKLKKQKKNLDIENLVYRINEYTHSFKNLRTVNNFGRDIYNGKITLKEADEDQSSFWVEIMDFKIKKPCKNPEKKQETKHILNNLYASFFEARARVRHAFENKIFPIKNEGTHFSEKVSDHSNIKMLTPQQMPQGLPIALAQVKTGNTTENLLNEIKQIIYSLYQAKEITKRAYNNLMNSVKGEYKNEYQIYEY